jgi:hypothetical protein
MVALLRSLKMSDFLLISALICVVWGIVSMIAMTSFLTTRGQKVNFLLYRVLVYKYIRQYVKITTEEFGKPGFWYSSFTTAMKLALIFAVLGLIVHFS